MDSFQVTLPSNASGKTFPNNRPAHYETDLMAPLHLEGPWEVSLIDIMYPHSWNNLSKPITMVIQYIEWVNGIDEVKMLPQIEIKPQYFETPDVFCHRLNRLVSNLLTEITKLLLMGKDVVRFSYDGNDDRITISSEVLNADNKRICIGFTEKAIMQRMLGIDAEIKSAFGEAGVLDTIVIKKNKPAVANRPPEFDAFPLMFVYTDLIQYQLIGDIKAPILAVLPVSGKAGEQVYWNCNPQSFIPLAKSEIRTVEIRLCTETGETFPIIGNGKVITRLNFRRRLV